MDRVPARPICCGGECSGQVLGASKRAIGDIGSMFQREAAVLLVRGDNSDGLNQNRSSGRQTSL